MRKCPDGSWDLGGYLVQPQVQNHAGPLVCHGPITTKRVGIMIWQWQKGRQGWPSNHGDRAFPSQPMSSPATCTGFLNFKHLECPTKQTPQYWEPLNLLSKSRWGTSKINQENKKWIITHKQKKLLFDASVVSERSHNLLPFPHVLRIWKMGTSIHICWQLQMENRKKIMVGFGNYFLN